MGKGLHIFSRDYGTYAPTQRANFMAQIILKLGYNPSFLALDWLSSVSGATIWLKH